MLSSNFKNLSFLALDTAKITFSLLIFSINFICFKQLFFNNCDRKILNEFLPNVWEVRKHANSEKNNYHSEIKKMQLHKAMEYFIKVKKIVYEVG